MAIQPTIKKQISDIEKKEIAYRTLTQKALMTNQMTNDTIQIPFASYTKM